MGNPITLFGFHIPQKNGFLDFDDEETHFLGFKQKVDIQYEMSPQLFRSKETYSELRRIAKFHSNFPDYQLEIVVHTDSRGTYEMNKILSQKRAESVKFELFQKYAIDTSKFTPIGYGESQPLVSDSLISITESREKKEYFYQLNRRTEIVLIGK